MLADCEVYDYCHLQSDYLVTSPTVDLRVSDYLYLYLTNVRSTKFRGSLLSFRKVKYSAVI